MCCLTTKSRGFTKIYNKVIMSNRKSGHVLVLPSRQLVRLAADDDFFYMSKRTYGHVLVLPSRLLVRPATDDEFVTKILKVKICFFLKKKKKNIYMCSVHAAHIFLFGRMGLRHSFDAYV